MVSLFPKDQLFEFSRREEVEDVNVIITIRELADV